MAFLKSTRLKCPNCDFTADIQIVVGVGPGFDSSKTVPYKSYRRPEGCVEGADENGERDGTLRCPADHAVLWTNRAEASKPPTSGELRP